MSSSEDSSDDGSSSSDDSSSENESEQSQVPPTTKRETFREESDSPKPVAKKERVRERSRSRDRRRRPEYQSRRRRSPSPRGRRDRGGDRRRYSDYDRRDRRDRDYKRHRSDRMDIDDEDDELQGQPPSPSPPPILRAIKRKRQAQEKERDKRKRKKSQRKRLEEKLVAALPGLTRIARRIYAGNLSASVNHTEESLIDMFDNICPLVGIKRADPVVSVWISPEKTFCFVEFKTVRDADKAMTAMQNYRTINGRELRIGRPKNYEDVPEFMKDFILGERIPKIPRDYDIESLDIETLEQAARPVDSNRPFQSFFGNERGGGRGRGGGFNNNNNNGDRFSDNYRKNNRRNEKFVAPTKSELDAFALPLPGKGSFQAQKNNPGATRVILLSNDLFVGELADEASHRSLVTEIKQECKRFGRVLKMKVPEDRTSGCVFVKYNTIDFAVKAKAGINHKLFGGRKIVVTFWNEVDFDNDIFSEKDRRARQRRLRKQNEVLQGINARPVRKD